MCLAKLHRKFVCSLSDYLQLFNKAEKDDIVFFCLFDGITFTAIYQIINSSKHMNQPFFVSNALSHRF